MSGSMTASRSRLVQELLEQNSAMLQKLKDRSTTDERDEEPERSDVSTHLTHHPFPTRQPAGRPPKDVAVKLGLYSAPPQKY